METQFQTGAPNALCQETGGGRWLARGRSSVFAVFPACAVLAISLGAPRLARAQQWPSPASPNPEMPHSNFPQSSAASDPDVGNPVPNDPMEAMETAAGMLPLMPIDNSRLINDESCRTWTAAAVDSPTVSVVRLEVPGKASHEFQKACGDFKDHKLKSAEDHARRAVKIYPDYAAAWVLLGQILQADHKDQEAIDACQNGKNADPTYAPPYICLAGFAATANDWDEAYALADHALTLDPATDPYAYLYTATAEFHLKRIDRAELYAKSAEKLDKWKHIPEVHILLAQIYEEQGQPGEEASELRKYLKDSPHDADWELAKNHLAEIEKRVSK
jgi:tetratricopeptide (TPR) repeat protein